MRVLFSTSRWPIAALIRTVTWSRWSHVALIDGDDVIEALWPRVKVSPLADAIAARPNHVIVDLPCNAPDEVIRAARAQVGKPYDLLAIFGLLMHRNWQETDRWFCSELVAWAFNQAGSPLFRAEAMHRITPQNLWILAPARPEEPLRFFTTMAGDER